MKKLLQQLLLLLPVISAQPLFAESQDFGDYTVYYQAVNSTFIKADIAAQYGIVRGQRNAFLNISVIKNEKDGTTTAVPAAITGSKTNLLQQTETITFREIREEDSIYYIGEFEFSNAQNVRFDVEVQPESMGETYTVSWNTRLYND